MNMTALLLNYHAEVKGLEIELRRWRTLAIVAVLTAVLLLLAGAAKGASVTLAWDPPTNNVDGTPVTDLAGYKILYGTNSGGYTSVTNVGNVTTGTVSSLMAGTMYYFVARAYNTFGDESDNSNELRWIVPDTVAPSFVTNPTNRSIRVAKGGSAPVPDFWQGVTLTDNCWWDATVTNAHYPLRLTQSPAAGTVVGIGITTVTMTARDASSNSVSKTATFTVYSKVPKGVGGVWVP